jgi:hypothetical protein
MSSDPTKTGVKYIGNDTPFVDNLYGSGLKFMPDQTRLVEPELAAKLTRHAEFVDDDTFDYVTATKTLTGGSELSPPSAYTAVQSAVPKSLDKIRTVLLYGDSGVQYANKWLAVNLLVNDGSGTCVYTSGTAHYFLTGTKARIVNSTDPYWSAEFVITWLSTTSFSFPLDPRAAPAIVSTIRAPVTSSMLCIVPDSHQTRAGIFHALNAKLGAPWVYMGNMAANMKPAWHMVDDLDRDLAKLPERPDAIWLQAGANDSRASGFSAEVAVINTQQLIKKIINKGISVFFQCWMPNDSRDTLFYTTAGKNATRFNVAMRSWCAQQNGVYYISREVLVNPASALGSARAGVLGSDGVHDTSVSAEMCALDAYKKYSKLVPRTIPLPWTIAEASSDVLNISNRFQNPLFLTTAGGTSPAGGTVPGLVAVSKFTGSTTFSGAGGGTTYSAPRTIDNDGDDYGNNVVARAEFTAAGDDICIDLQGFMTGINVGDRVRFGLHVKTKFVSGARISYCGVHLQPKLSGTWMLSHVVALGDGNLTSTLPLPADTDEVIFTPWFLCMVDMQDVRCRVWVMGSGVGVTDIEIGRPTMEKQAVGAWSNF